MIANILKTRFLIASGSLIIVGSLGAMSKVSASELCGAGGSTWKGSPLDGPITQIFGTAWSANCSDKKHSGVDIDGKAGDKVFAAAPGEIVHVGKDDFWGPSLVIRHTDGTARAYLHINPVIGSGKVEAGDLIGTLYDLPPHGPVPAGKADGDHLHYNVCVQADGCQAGAVETKKFPGIFLDPIAFELKNAGHQKPSSAVVTPIAGAYDKSVAISGKSVPLPENSRKLSDAPCTADTLKRMRGKTSKLAKCFGETKFQGTTFAGFSNYSRSVDQPGALRIFAIGKSVRDLGSVSTEAEVVFTEWSNSNLEVLGFVPSGWNGKLTAQPPFVRYRVEGRPDFYIMRLVSEGPNIGKASKVQLDKENVAQSIANLQTAREKESQKPSLGRTILGALKPANDVQDTRNVGQNQSGNPPTRSSAGRGGSRPETKEEIACRFAVWTGVTENLPDLFDCDTPRAIANLSEGRQFKIVVGKISFANGKLVVTTRQNPSRADYLVDRMNDKSKENFWDNWNARTSMGAWYTITCIFPPSAGTRLKEGATVQVFGKLESYANSRPVLNCS